MADTEMDEADQTPEQAILGFGVLQFIRTAQSQHGLRHSDYKRYRSEPMAILHLILSCFHIFHSYMFLTQCLDSSRHYWAPFAGNIAPRSCTARDET